MAALPSPTPRTLAALDAAMEAAQDAEQRAYLGASQIGHPCSRHLFYSFRWCAERRMSASGLRAVQDGFTGEEVMAGRLRLISGIELHTETQGQQFDVSTVAGHVRGHLDGAIRGVLEAPKTWHVWEHKQVNEAKFKKLQKLVADVGEKSALKEWDAIYFGQAIIYMGLTDMGRHFLTVGTPGGREYTSVRTEMDEGEFARLKAKAETIVRAAEPPLRLSEDPAWFECKFCPYHAICHTDAVPATNCRTCAHATPVMDGQDGAWRCELKQRTLTLAEQRKGCPSHLYIPPLLERIGRPVDGDDTHVVYETAEGGRFVNGPAPGFSSIEIRAAGDKRALCDASVQGVKAAFPTARVTA